MNEGVNEWMDSSPPNLTDADIVCASCVLFLSHSLFSVLPSFHHHFIRQCGSQTFCLPYDLLLFTSFHIRTSSGEESHIPTKNYPLKDMETHRIACWLLHLIKKRKKNKKHFAICSPAAAGLFPSHENIYLLEWKFLVSRCASSLLQFCVQICYLSLQIQFKCQICPSAPAHRCTNNLQQLS